MLAVINLFIHILKYPNISSVQEDLALLDIAAGHFGHVKLLTASEVEFTFPREISSITDNFLQHRGPESTDAVTSDQSTVDFLRVVNDSETPGNINDLSDPMVGTLLLNELSSVN